MPKHLSIVLALLGGALTPAVHAGPLAISPTTVEIAPGRRSAVVEVENNDDQPVDLQLRAYAWDQVDGRDHLTQTGAIVVSPAIVTVPPHGKQLFRVLQVAPPAGAGEQAFRLRLNQLPRAVDRGVGIHFEFLLPLFVGGRAEPEELHFALEGDTLRLRNDGDQHVRVRELAMQLPDGTRHALPQASATYLLPKRAASWPVAGRDLPADARLVAVTDKGLLDVPSALVALAR